MRAAVEAFRQLGRPFVCLWLGEVVTALGSVLLQFALGVWIYQETGSAEQFSLALFSGMLPALLLLPLAGACADLFDRRAVLIGCDLVLLALVLTLAALAWSGGLRVPAMVALSSLASLTYTFRRPSYQVALSLLLPQRRLSQANGLRMLGESSVQFAGPMLAGALMARHGIGGVMLLEVALILCATALVLAALAGIGRDAPPPEAAGRTWGAVWRHCRSGVAATLAYMGRQAEMRALLIYMLLQTSLVALVSSMLTPMVLAGHDSGVLGGVMSSAAVGAIIGSALVVVWNPQRRLMRTVLLADLALAVCVAAMGWVQTPLSWSGMACLAMLAGNVSSSCLLSLWMSHTPLERRGSLFSLLGAINIGVVALTLLAGGVLVERVLEPGMMPGGALAGLTGGWLGEGKGRGIALLFVLCGLACMAVALGALRFVRLDRLDEAARAGDEAAPPLAAAGREG
ncbi:MFS transporter [Chromobacterium sp. CV08]|uniref:MFS transporter n=1 Tax=Chromobacterium sp. CV08 TaxID=3133274 RepID=UPI003DAA2E4D